MPTFYSSGTGCYTNGVNANTADVWPQWCTGTTSGNINAADPWYAWTNATVTTATQTWTTQVWVAWNTTLCDGYTRSPAAASCVAPTVSEYTARDRLVRANRARASAMRTRVAERRAEALLLEHLDEAQRAEWTKDKVFHVETRDGTRRYRISRGLAGNVKLVRDGDRQAIRGDGGEPYISRYCCHVYHPDGSVPLEDNVLAQKLLIEADEAEFLRLANVS